MSEAQGNAALTPEEKKEKARLKKLQKEQEKKEKEERKKKIKEEQEKLNQLAQKNKSESTSGKKKKEKKEEQFTFVNTTPEGEKKKFTEKLSGTYHPEAIEAAWYTWWQKQGYFKPEFDQKKNRLLKEDEEDSRETFTIIIPPPNVTGYLHLGHALTNSVQDTIVRYQRMRGLRVLWVPGSDHAGIATQTVVEKKLLKEGKTRHDLGREAFVNEVWNWKNEKGGFIKHQLRRLGSSLDWDREFFTLDDTRASAVQHSFKKFFEKGLIYRDTRLVNWCCKLNTAISDIEVDHIEFDGIKKMEVPGHTGTYEFGAIWTFYYQLEGSDQKIEIATTRPETILGDTAIAVHPKDPRYKDIIGKFALHPFSDRKIPIIADGELVDMNFGSGAVKITPAHDPNDFRCGIRNNLQSINVMNDDGTMNENCGKFAGMKRFDARYAVLETLKEKGLYKDIKKNPMSIGVCSRSGDIIEPLLKPQWFLNCKEMGARALKLAQTGELKFVPSSHTITWVRWLENIQDWCISRQLWWGHRIPAYLVTLEGEAKNDIGERWLTADSEEEALEKAKAKFGTDKLSVKQDEDVLDTWYSSGLLPFSSMGWPNQTPDLSKFFPNTLLETGHDIIFFWVARMVMFSLELLDVLPFKTVFLHAMVRDAQGRKMSKSKGNVVDPIDLIEGISLEGLHKKLLEGNLPEKEIQIAKEGQQKNYPKGIPECGTDATRFGLCSYTSHGRSINLEVSKIESYRNFCNKLYNSCIFALGTLGQDFKPTQTENVLAKTPAENWILARLNQTITLVIENMSEYNLGEATNNIYSWWLYDFCDNFIEIAKPYVYGDEFPQETQDSYRQTIYTCMDNGFRLLHPFMPFLTEELFQRLPRRPGQEIESIMIAPFPTPKPERVNPQLENAFLVLFDVTKKIRSNVVKYNLQGKKPTARVNVLTKQDIFDTIQENAIVIQTLAKTPDLTIKFQDTDSPQGFAIELSPDYQVLLQVKGLIDADLEITKLTRKLKESQSSLEKTKKLLEQPNVKPEAKKKFEEKVETLTSEIQILEMSIQTFQSFK